MFFFAEFRNILILCGNRIYGNIPVWFIGAIAMDKKYLDIYYRVLKIARKSINEPESNIYLGPALKYLNDEAAAYAADFIVSLREYEIANDKSNVRYNQLLFDTTPITIYKAFSKYINTRYKLQKRRNEMSVDLSSVNPQPTSIDIFAVIIKILPELTPENQTLIVWRLGFITEETACYELGIKHSQLFARWRSTKSELFGQIKGMLR